MPDQLTEKVIGFRFWPLVRDFQTSAPRLDGIAQWGVWRPGVNVAHCVRDHVAPDSQHGCGLHAYVDPDVLRYPRHHSYGGARHVRGAVALWGVLEAHKTTVRAQYAEIVALADQAPADDELARTYNVPLVPLEDLEAVALEHGRLFPSEWLVA